MAQFVSWQIEEFGLGENDKFSLLSGLSHDPLLREIFSALCAGGCLCIPEVIEEDAEELAEWIEEKAISVMHLTPGLGQLLNHGLRGVKKLERARYAFFAGDKLSAETVAKLKEKAPGIQSVNFYGATETPQAVGYYRVEEEEGNGELKSLRIPIGRGRKGVELVVVNERGKEAGAWELGEICVRTPYLAKGYLQETEKDKERFCEEGQRGKERMYKTGDYGVYREDGQIELVGRKDEQIKVRGFRVELGEVEANVRQIKGVKQAAVVCVEDEVRGSKLKGYVAFEKGEEKSEQEMREILKERLPDYMIPSSIAFLEQLPLTPNGKIDRKALSTTQFEADEPNSACVEPRTPVERDLALVWSEVLGRSCISIHDSFFELGGHSLLAVQLIIKVRESFGVELPLRTVFSSGSTIARMAEEIVRYQLQQAGDEELSQIMADLERAPVG